MKIVITGFNGFVGNHLVQKILSETDHQLTLCGRTAPSALLSSNESRVSFLETTGLEDNIDWGSILGKEYEVVVHLAAILPWGKSNFDASQSGMFNVANADASAALCSASVKRGVSKFIFLSTIGINGTTNSPSTAFTPNSASAAVGNYAVSKLNAESQLTKLNSKEEFQLSMIRAPILYGEGCVGPFRKLFNAVKSGKVLPLKSIDSNSRDMLSVYNLVDLILHLIEKEARKGSEVLLPSDNESVSTVGLVNKIGLGLGVSPRLVSFPAGIFRFLSILPVVGGAFSRLLGDLIIEDPKLASEIGWHPKYSVEKSISMMATAEGVEVSEHI